MKTNVIAVRHGETEWNKIEKQQGHFDSNLTDLGNLQAKAIGSGLKRFKIDKFYSSDLGRAIQTSKIISEIINLNFTVEEKLRERKLGVLQGLTKREFKLKHPSDWLGFDKNDPDYIIPGGESIRQRFERAIKCVEGLSVQNLGSTVLIVSHGGILMSMIYKVFNLPLNQKKNFSLFNGSINMFTISDKLEWNLEIWGETSHLREFGLEALDDN